MITFGSTMRYYFWQGIVDMRKGIDGLSGLIRNEMGYDPLDGGVYIFLNRRRNQVKLLIWDRSGFVLYLKRLERGVFEYPKAVQGGQYVVSWQGLVLMLEGIRLEDTKQKKHYSYPQVLKEC